MSVNTYVPITSGASQCDAIIQISGTFCTRRPLPSPGSSLFRDSRVSLAGRRCPAERDFYEDCLMRRLIFPALFVLLLLCFRLPVDCQKVDSAKTAYDKGDRRRGAAELRTSLRLFQAGLQPEAKRPEISGRVRAHPLPMRQLRRCIAGRLRAMPASSTRLRRTSRKRLTSIRSSFIAQQELKRTQQMIKEAQDPPAAGCRCHSACAGGCNPAQGPVELAPISNAPITLKVTEKSNVIYETVGKLAGINVLFDPDYTPQQVRIELNGVTLEEALRIISFRDQNLLASGDAQHDFCRARQSRKAERAGTKRPQNFLSFQSFSAHRIAGCRERDAHHSRSQPNSAAALAGSNRGARHSRPGGAGAEAGGRSRQGEA